MFLYAGTQSLTANVWTDLPVFSGASVTERATNSSSDVYTSVTSTSITLPAGAYLCLGTAILDDGNNNGINMRLYNSTDATTTLASPVSHRGYNVGRTATSINGMFAITGSKTFNLQFIFSVIRNVYYPRCYILQIADGEADE